MSEMLTAEERAALWKELDYPKTAVQRVNAFERLMNSHKACERRIAELEAENKQLREFLIHILSFKPWKSDWFEGYEFLEPVDWSGIEQALAEQKP